jgi:hypothetical protein
LTRGFSESWRICCGGRFDELYIRNTDPPIRRLVAALVILASVLAPIRAAEKRPNILFLFADGWGRHASAYALVDGPGGISDVIRTPHFDRVARRSRSQTALKMSGVFRPLRHEDSVAGMVRTRDGFG